MHTHTCIHAETAHTNTCTPKHTYTRARTQHAARIFTPAVGAEGNGVYGLGVAAQRVHTSALLHIPQLHGGVKGGGGQQQREMGVGRVGARGTPPVVGTCTGCRQWAHARVAGNGRMHRLQAMGTCTGCRQWAHARVAGNGHMHGLQAMGACTGRRQMLGHYQMQGTQENAGANACNCFPSPLPVTPSIYFAARVPSRILLLRSTNN